MSQADELLDSLTEPEIETYSANPDTEPHIVVNADKTVSVPEELKHIAVQGEHNIETVTFDCPRYWDGHDLSQMSVRINYQRPDGHREPHLAENLRVDDIDTSMIHFDWTISNNATAVKGNISFMVCAKIADVEGVTEREWHSQVNQDLIIDEGLECSGDEIVEQNPDILEAILARLDTLESTGSATNPPASTPDSGENPTNGITPHIGENGNWYLGETDTGVKAAGEDGDDGVSPHIGTNGNWYIGTTDTGVKAQGENGKDGSDYVLTDTDKSEIAAMALEMLGGNPVWGVVDANNHVTVHGLSEGKYTFGFVMEDGSIVDGGSLELDNNTYYSVTSYLTNCANSNSAAQVVAGGSYEATITADSGYELASITLTMGGEDITDQAVNGCNITVARVEGDIVITAAAEEVQAAEPTNFFVAGGDGYLNPGRASSAGADRTDVTACFLTNYIEVQNGDTIYAYGACSSNANVGQTGLYKADKSGVGFYLRNATGAEYLTDISMSDEVDSFTINYDGAAYIRVCCLIPSDLSAIKINIKRNGEWL